MRPLRINLCNFRSFEDETTLDLASIHLATIHGANRAGKSSLLVDSILFALYGKARKTVEKLINDLAQSMWVKLTFAHNGAVYRVERSISRGSSPKLRIYADETDLTERGGLVTANQKILDNILKISYDLLLSTGISQQEDINKLSKMTPGDREQIINEMLANQHWETKKKKVGEILTRYKDLSRTVESAKNSLEVHTNSLALIDMDITNWERHQLPPMQLEYKTLSEHEASLTLKAKQYNVYGNQKIEYHHQLTLLNQLESQLNNNKPPRTYEQIQKTIDQCHQLMDENERLITDFYKTLEPLEAQIKDTAKWEVEAGYIARSQLDTKILDEVPCKELPIHRQCKLLAGAFETKDWADKLLETSGAKSVKEFQFDKLTLLNKLSDRKKQLTHSRDRWQLEIFKANTEISAAKQEADKLKWIDELRDQITDQRRKVDEAAKKLDNPPIFDEQLYSRIQTGIKTVSNNIQNIKTNIAVKEREFELKTAEIKKLQDELATYKETEEKLADYHTLYDAYATIPSELFEQAIPTIEQYTNDILKKIFPEERINLRSFRETKANTLQKTLDVVGSTSTGTRDFEDLSESERFRQSLALRIALAKYNSEQNNAQINFFIIDEGFGNLDDENMIFMKQMLRQMTNTFDLFLVVTHTTALKDTFSTQIIVNPTGKTNKLEVLNE